MKERSNEEIFKFLFGSSKHEKVAKIPAKKGRVEKSWRFMLPLDAT